MDFTGGELANAIGGENDTTGAGFSVSSSIVISGLGIFDAGANGLEYSTQVGLWTSSGTLLASVTVDNSGNTVASTSGLGDWLEEDITPVTLDPGSYVLGAYYLNVDVTPGDEGGHGVDESSITGITYDGWDSFFGGSSLTFPTFDNDVSDTEASFFGPMAFTSPAPEPGSLVLMLGAGVFCIGMLWVRRFASARRE
jgi:hypothetical protein